MEGCLVREMHASSHREWCGEKAWAPGGGKASVGRACFHSGLLRVVLVMTSAGNKLEDGRCRIATCPGAWPGTCTYSSSPAGSAHVADCPVAPFASATSPLFPVAVQPFTVQHVPVASFKYTDGANRNKRRGTVLKPTPTSCRRAQVIVTAFRNPMCLLI